jgi:hypothetical protein
METLFDYFDEQSAALGLLGEVALVLVDQGS